MKNGVFVIALLLWALVIIINSPILLLIWFLGGNNPFKALMDAFDCIVCDNF